MQQHRGVQILGDGGHREPADLVERRAPEDSARSAEEARVVDISPWLDDVVEHVLLVGDVFLTAQTVLEEIGIEEVMRALHLRDARIAEMTDRFREERADRHVISVEGRDEIS